MFGGRSVPGPVSGAENVVTGERVVSSATRGQREPLPPAVHGRLLSFLQPRSLGSSPSRELLPLTWTSHRASKPLFPWGCVCVGVIPVLTFWDRRQGSVSKFSTWPRGARAHVSAGCHQPALCRSRCGTFVSSSVHRGSDGTALLHATVISHVKSLHRAGRLRSGGCHYLAFVC